MDRLSHTKENNYVNGSTNVRVFNIRGDNMNFHSMIPDIMYEGIIAVDSKGNIKIYNKMAKDVFGINPDEGPGHKEGIIEKGDIVIIADNMLGADDGGMEPEDLKIIGVDPQCIKKGYAIVAIGKKGAKVGSATWKYSTDWDITNLNIEANVDGMSIHAKINLPNKRICIKVNDTYYNYDYFWAAGHMVIIDGKTLDIKFYQCKGYTARKEPMRHILTGGKFKGKGQHGKPLKTLEKHILDLHPDSDVINKLIEVASGNSPTIKGMESMINGIPVRCSVKAFNKSGKRIGAILEIADISELKAAQIEREKALENLKSLQNRLKTEEIQRQAFSKILGESVEMKRVIHIAKKAALTDSTVLLQGESGTGKNLFAEAIHKASPRRKDPFIYINCASIPENLLESELFGHEKGAFTGAISKKPGKFELAHKGTIFLDEINELPKTLQAKMLHVLQSRTFTRVGGIEPIKVDIRIIVASNKNLEKLVADGSFRNDLFYRVNVISIHIPPLREHKEDIYLLIQTLFDDTVQRGVDMSKTISPEVLKIFFEYDWPGNIRELENVLERAKVMSGEQILPEHLPQHMLKSNEDISDESLVEVTNLGPLKDILEEAEKKAITKALKTTKGNRKKAMDLLKMGKTNFYDKIKRFGITE
ncbi:MAG: sigma 54-interacting transcriptional regulator [Tepidanaerobacteraceae bacterium]